MVLQEVFSTGAVKQPEDAAQLQVEKAAQLFAAVRAIDRKTVRQLLDDGVSPNVRDADGNTPLMIAARGDTNLTIAGMLLGRGADVNAVNNRGDTALTRAFNAGDQLTRLLLTFDADPLVITEVSKREKLLFLAVAGGNTKTVDVLVQAGVKPTITNTSQETLLYIAAQAGDATMAEKMIGLGISPNACTAKGFSPLRAAMSNQNPAVAAQYLDCIRVLLDARANPNNEVNDRTGWSDNTHIDYGYAQKKGGEIAVLVAEVKNRLDLISYAKSGNLQGVLKLVAEGVKCDALDDNGNHALHEAMSCSDARQRPAIVKALLEGKADPELPTASGEFPISSAAKAGDAECVRLLLQAGAGHSPASPGQPYPLHLAVQSGNAECVRLLIEAGASTFVKDGKGDTPFDYAASMKHTHEKVFDAVADRRDAELKSWAEDSVRTNDATSGMKTLKFKPRTPS